jgi:hypothetical protein
MTDETLRSRNRWVIFLALVITLGPLVPYALRGDRQTAQPGVGGVPAPAESAPASGRAM